MAALTLYPAIDLLGGKCVRLRQGDYSQVTVFDDDPVHMARHWQESGARWLHVVDLDGALAGEPKHLHILRAIVRETGLPVQTGGGLRTDDAVQAALDAGVARVLLGTAALRDKPFVLRALERWGERIAVSVDSRGGKVTVAGWLELATESATTFALAMMQAGVKTLVHTNVERDGTLAGTDASTLAELRAALPDVHLIAAGGIASLDDVRALIATGVDGAVLGRALYEGTLDLAEATALAAGPASGEEPSHAG